MNENDILRQAVEALQASVASLSENHRKEVDALQSKIKEQEAQIAWLKRQLFGRKSEKRPVFDPNCPDLFADLLPSPVVCSVAVNLPLATVGSVCLALMESAHTANTCESSARQEA